MSGTLTVVAAGGATVPATGTYTALGLGQVAYILSQAQTIPGSSNVIIYDPANPVIPPPADVGPSVLIVPNDVGAIFPASITVPSGYAAVILGQGSNVNVTNTDPSTRILSGGTINFQGVASLVDASGGAGTITDTAAQAVIEIGGGAYSVDASSGSDTVSYDNGLATITALNDAVLLGDGFLGGTYLQQYPAGTTVTGATVNSLGGDAITVNSTGNLILDNSGAGNNTITGLFGSSTVFAGANDFYNGTGNPAAVKFIADSIAGSTQTVSGGAGNDTVFGAAANVLYNQGSGSQSYFIAGSGDSTVNAAGAGAVFGSTGSTLLNTGSGNDYFIGGNGNDTVVGGLNPTATVFSGTNENLVIKNTRTAIVVPTGNNDTINASGTFGGTDFFAASAFNATLVGNPTSASPDLFVVYAQSQGAAAHTVTIDNWHAGDGLFLQAYGKADVTHFDQVFNGGGSSVVLSDGTTITFNGAHPAHASGTVAF